MEALTASFLAGAALALGLAAGYALGRTRRAPAPPRDPVPLATDLEVGEGHKPPDPTALAAATLGLVRRHCGASGAAFLVLDGRSLRVASASPGARVAWNRAFNVGGGLAALALDSSREVAADPVQGAALPFLEGETGPLAAVLTPVSRRGGRSGLLACWRPAGRPFEDDERDQMVKAGALLAGWEASASHLARLEAEGARVEKMFRGLERMLKQTEPLEIAGLALDTLFDLLPARKGFVVLPGQAGRYSGVQTRGFDPPEGLANLDRNSWAYFVLSKEPKPLYLDGAVGRETGKVIFYTDEPFPAERRVAFLHPLRGAGDPLGVVGLVGSEDNPFGQAEREAAVFLLGQVGALVELALLNKQHQEMALTDALTGLYNRRHFEERLRLELRRAQREGTGAALLICDLDHFKRVNDTYGHPAGDVVLREAARRIGEAVRDVDVVCRYGGEEFAVVLPSCELEEAAQVAERLRRSVAGLPIPIDASTALPLTVSVGVSAFPRPVDNAVELARSADQALYRAKTQGRDRVERVRN